jgi:hypothetical protein
VTNRQELISVRDAVIRYLHLRAPVEEVREVAVEAGRSMQADGLTVEDMLIVLRGAVSLAADHVSQPSATERAVWLRSQMTTWLLSLYMNEDGEFDEPPED